MLKNRVLTETDKDAVEELLLRDISDIDLNDNSKVLMIGCFRDEELIGVSALFMKEDGKSEIKLCFVKPDYRGSHLMQFLVNKLVKLGRKKGNVLAISDGSNIATCKTLERVGFRSIEKLEEDKILYMYPKAA